MTKTRENKYIVLTMLLNIWANSQFVEANEYPFPLKFHFDGKTFLLVTIFIISVSYLKKENK